MKPGFSYRLTTGLVMLHPSTKAPIMETGREAVTTIHSQAVPSTEADAREMFLALVHQGAESLWEREVKPLWFPEKTPSQRPSKT